MAASFLIDIVVRPRNAQRQIDSVDKSLKGLDNTADDLARKLDRVFKVGGATILLAQLVSITDTYTTLVNKVDAVTNSLSEQNAVVEEVFAIANRARVPIEAVGTAYQRLRNSTLEMGLSQKQVLRMTETLAKGLMVYGSTQSEAASTMTQFTQALQAGKLNGDEFRSVMENSPAIIELLTKQLKVSKGEL